MKNPVLKKLLPHIIAIVVFIIVAVLFCKPVLDGNVLNQDDITKWKGIAQNSFDYKEKTGHFPLWNPNIFSGLPNYQIAMQGKTVLPDMIKVLSLGLPKPINFFFLACICFYILCLALGSRPVLAILGGLAFAFSTYNAVVINAGHDTQMFATAFMPLLLAGLILTYEKKYWLGLAISTLAAYMQVGANHLQITYYFFLVAAVVTLSYLFIWIRKKEWKHMMIAGCIAIVAGLVGLAGSAMTLMTTAEYTKYTIRGDKSISIDNKTDSVTSTKTSGLDTSYAFEYSLGKAESFTLLMPNAFGGGNQNRFNENSKIAKKLIDRGVNEGDAQGIAQQISKYWGELPYTAGPAYLGVFIFILGLIGFVIIKTPLRWGLLSVTLLGIILSWGKNFAGFNTFLFEHLPLYNKFRAPSMAQVIPQLTITVVAILALQQLLFTEKSKELLQSNFKKILYVTGGLFAVLGLMYMMMTYSLPSDSYISSGVAQYFKNEDMGRAAISGLKADRMGMFGGQLLRALLFALILIGLLYFYMKNKIKPMVVVITLLVIGTAELLLTSKNYLPDESYLSPDDLQSQHFNPTQLEQQILQDKDPNFRVYNTTVNPLFDARTSSFFKSVTGYHPARLRIYQDVLDKYISGGNNPAVINMLNVKYFIVKSADNGPETMLKNPNTYGSCWLAKFVKTVDGPVEEFLALRSNNLKDTVVVDKTCKINPIVSDTSATIKMLSYDNDKIEYESNTNSPQFAVFSEVYYSKGWNAYLDDKLTEYCKVNYILRGLPVPAGNHKIKFVFEPASVKKGRSIMFIASILIIFIVIGGLFMAWKESRKKT